MSQALIVILTIVGYFGLLMLVSYFASRGSDNSTFFTGKRQAPWPLVAFAMIGAAISGVTFISVPGMVAAKGYAYLQMVLGFIVGYFVIAFVLVPLFYKKNLISIYGYLEERFGRSTYRAGAWFFFVSKMLGAAVRFFVVCAVLQLLVFAPLHIPFIFNVIVTIALIWLYTVQGGVKTLIWTDTLKSFCLIMSVILCIYFVATNLGFNFGEMASSIRNHDKTQMFFFDNPMEATYFWKQFLAGVFMAIATNGLDQDMMQRNLACKNTAQSQKNMIGGLRQRDARNCRHSLRPGPYLGGLLRRRLGSDFADDVLHRRHPPGPQEAGRGAAHPHPQGSPCGHVGAHGSGNHCLLLSEQRGRHLGGLYPGVVHLRTDSRPVRVRHVHEEARPRQVGARGLRPGTGAELGHAMGAEPSFRI